MLWSRGQTVFCLVDLVETEMFWSRRSKRISHGRTCSDSRCFGRAGRNVPRMVELGRNLEVRGRAHRNVTRMFDLVETEMFWSRRSKRISLGRTWSKHRCFGRAGRNVSRMVELGRNLDVLVSGSNRISLGRLGRNRDVLVAPVETYLAWSNLVNT